MTDTTSPWPPEQLAALLDLLRNVPSLAGAEIHLAHEAYDALTAWPGATRRLSVWRLPGAPAGGVIAARVQIAGLGISSCRALTAAEAADEAEALPLEPAVPGGALLGGRELP